MDEREVDIAVATEAFPWIAGVFRLQPSAEARSHPDCLLYAIALTPYGINELVETHYTLLESTDARDAVGRVLYVDGARPQPSPMAHSQRIVLATADREAGLQRISVRRARAAAQRSGAKSLRHEELERALEGLARKAGNEEIPAGDANAPYRTRTPNAAIVSDATRTELRQRLEFMLGDAAIAISLSGVIVDIVKDPFPSPPRPRVLVIDDDDRTADRLREAGGMDVTAVEDGWTAIDLLAAHEFDLVICAVVLGDFTGAKIHRMTVKTRPDLAAKIVFLASARAVAGATASSASYRVLERPIDPRAVKALLSRRP